MNLSKVAESSPLMTTPKQILQDVGIDTVIDVTGGIKRNNNAYAIADKVNSDKKGTNQQYFQKY